MPHSNSDTDSAENKVVLEAYRLAEQHLKSHVEIALAADQRSTNFCGFVVTALGALVGLTDGAETPHWSVSAAAALLAVSALLSAWSARPTRFHIAGIPFANFKSDIEKKRTLPQVSDELAAIYDDQAKENRRCIRSNARVFRAALVSAAAGLLLMVSPVVWLPLIELMRNKWQDVTAWIPD